MNGKKRQLMCARRKIGARALQCAFKFLPRRCSEKNITTYVHIQTSAPIGALEVNFPGILGKINGPITKEPTDQQTDMGSYTTHPISRINPNVNIIEVKSPLF